MISCVQPLPQHPRIRLTHSAVPKKMTAYLDAREMLETPVLGASRIQSTESREEGRASRVGLGPG